MDKIRHLLLFCLLALNLAFLSIFGEILFHFFANNLISAQQNPEIVSAKISKELAAGRLAGPFNSPPLPNFRVSPLGVVPKKAPGEYRLIHHLSFPRGASVNDGISTVDTSVQYARVDDAVTMIKQLGQGCFFAKTDIKSAFRIIPIQPRDYDLLGIFWQRKYYYDRIMSMGQKTFVNAAFNPHSG